jgi:hypothetical protein
MTSDQPGSANQIPEPEPKAYLSSVIAQGRPSAELTEISNMSITLLIRVQQEGHRHVWG